MSLSNNNYMLKEKFNQHLNQVQIDFLKLTPMMRYGFRTYLPGVLLVSYFLKLTPMMQ